ncbi:hypothetical protein ANAPH2_00222 [Anaplasma phagocytophilum]|nr:hypothetical protein ANAPH2_00222 [Anaplasma phagocytophilum]
MGSFSKYPISNPNTLDLVKSNTSSSLSKSAACDPSECHIIMRLARVSSPPIPKKGTRLRNFLSSFLSLKLPSIASSMRNISSGVSLSDRVVANNLNHSMRKPLLSGVSSKCSGFNPVEPLVSIMLYTPFKALMKISAP